ncbi:hypothetical protein GBA52_012176 [Prunus armeniaca]|nr:hypothetical protein GBA52_012176 [Prunus armeniaca]
MAQISSLPLSNTPLTLEEMLPPVSSIAKILSMQLSNKLLSVCVGTNSMEHEEYQHPVLANPCFFSELALNPDHPLYRATQVRDLTLLCSVPLDDYPGYLQRKALMANRWQLPCLSEYKRAIRIFDYHQFEMPSLLLH